MEGANTVSRTQIYLGLEELALLDRASKETGASRSELIRRAVRATFGDQNNADMLRALQTSAGSWCGHRASGAECVDARRRCGGDLNERLSRLGVTPADRTNAYQQRNLWLGYVP